MNIDNENIRLEVAIEVMASKIASMSRAGYDIDSPEMKQLMEEKKKMYECDKEVIDKILNVYGKELRDNA